jgi:hypothetical protein
MKFKKFLKPINSTYTLKHGSCWSAWEHRPIIIRCVGSHRGNKEPFGNASAYTRNLYGRATEYINDGMLVSANDLLTRL